MRPDTFEIIKAALQNTRGYGRYVFTDAQLSQIADACLDELKGEIFTTGDQLVDAIEAVMVKHLVPYKVLR